MYVQTLGNNFMYSMPNIESERRFLKARVILQIMCNFFFCTILLLKIKPLLKNMTHIVECWPKITFQKSTFFPSFQYFWVRHFHGKFDTFSALLDDDVVSVTFTIIFTFIKRTLHTLSKSSLFPILFHNFSFTLAKFHSSSNSYLVKKDHLLFK